MIINGMAPAAVATESEGRKTDQLDGKITSEDTQSNTANQKLKFHPLADIFPLMEGAEFDALVDDIRANRLRDRIVLYEGMILDGRNRYRALRVLGVDLQAIRDQCCITRDCCVEHHGGPAAYVISANIHRRHLTAEQKRDLILKCADWSKSDCAIAAEMKTNKNTVGRLRKEAEQKATVPTGTVEKRVGKDGKARQQPAKKTVVKKVAPPTPVKVKKTRRQDAERMNVEADALVTKLVAQLDDATARELHRQLYSADGRVTWRLCEFLGRKLKIDGFVDDD